MKAKVNANIKQLPVYDGLNYDEKRCIHDLNATGDYVEL